MRRSVTHLRAGLDRDVHQVIEKLLEDRLIHDLSTSVVYDAIKRSNSSLQRKPKKLLEDSIERVLEVFLEEITDNDEEVDEVLARDFEQESRQDASNAMNRRLVQSWDFSSKNSPNSSRKQNGDINAVEVDGAAKKRTGDDQRAKNERQSKRSKSSKNLHIPATSSLRLDEFGGMDHVIDDLHEHLILPLLKPERYLRQHIKIPRGILLHGPPGCGKTTLCEAVAAELGLPFLSISAPSIVSGMSGESEKQLRQHFEKAIEMAPSIMFIDEIDAITPKRESAQREMERRIVGQLLTCMDDLALEKTGGKPVIVLAATNRPDSLDPALRRAGRFDKEVNIGVPTLAVREQILRAQTRKTLLDQDVDFALLAKKTPGFVGADMESLIYQASSAANKRYLAALQNIKDGAASTDVRMNGMENRPESTAAERFRKVRDILLEPQDPLDLRDDAIKMADFLAALPHVQPSAKREGFATIPDTTWSNIGALSDVRQELHDAIIKPIGQPDKYTRFGILAQAGVLLWGPPGCGKTLLAKAVANESKANFISVKGPELLNKYVGESERAIRQVFFRARSSAPCVVFFDELDALVPRRDDSLSEATSRVVNTLLTELDGMIDRSGIYVIAATNRPDIIDPAMLRPGRLGKHIYVGLPGPAERAEILTTLIRKMPKLELSVAKIAQQCNGFSGADLGSLVAEAVRHAVGRDAIDLDQCDLEAAASKVTPSVGDMRKYDRLRAEWPSSKH